MEQDNLNKKNENDTSAVGKTENDNKVGEEKPPIEIKEEIPEEVVEKIPELLPVLKGMGLVKSTKRVSFSGPLPPQVLNKLTIEQAGQLIDCFVKHSEARDKIQEKMLETMKDDEKNNRFHNSLRYTLISIFCLVIFITCVFTNNLNFIKDFLPYVALVVGGTGFGILYIKKKSDNTDNKNNPLEIE